MTELINKPELVCMYVWVANDTLLSGQFLSYRIVKGWKFKPPMVC